MTRKRRNLTKGLAAWEEEGAGRRGRGVTVRKGTEEDTKGPDNKLAKINREREATSIFDHK